MGHDENKQQIAVARRTANDLPNLEVQAEIRLYLNCNQGIMNEIAAVANDPFCMRLNVVIQRQNRACIFCQNHNDLHRLSLECRVDIFINGNMYVPDGARMCEQHLTENGKVPRILILGLHFYNRPIRIQGREIQFFLEQLRTEVLNKDRSYEMDNFTDDDFQCIFSLSKQNFENLLTYCDPDQDPTGMRYVSRKDLMLFLCKMRQGLSDEFLKTIFFIYSNLLKLLHLMVIYLSLLDHISRTPEATTLQFWRISLIEMHMR